MSKSTTDTSDRTSETSDSSNSESESASDSSEESSNATPKAESGDEAKVEQQAGETTSTTSAATDASKPADDSTATHEPPPPTTEDTDKAVTDTASEETEVSSITLRIEDEWTEAAATRPSNADVEHPVDHAAAATASQSTEEKTEPPAPSTVVRDEKVARVVGQAKSDVISKPESTSESEAHHTYQRTVVQQSQVYHGAFIWYFLL